MRVQSRGVAQAYGGCEFAGAARTVWRSRRGGVRSVPCDASVLVMRLGGRFCCPAHVECTCRKARRQRGRCSRVRRYPQGPPAW
jgi:hypothetical protein